MYLDFYRLNRAPFHITPDPDFLFPSPSHNEALAAIVYGAEKRKGFVAMTGEVGTGKTTILRAYLRREEGTDILPIYLFHPDLSFRDLVIKLSRELGLGLAEESTSELLEHLQVQLIEEYRENRTPVLIIDEAQNMPIETLEQLRMLTNLETSKDKLLQVVLVGQPELEEILNQHSLRQLKQRISVRATIQPLTDTESAAYIRSRVERAGSDAKYLFTNAALKEVVRLSNGIPRTINTLCDNALIAGYGMQQRPVQSKTVREAGRDLQLRAAPVSSYRSKWALGAVAAALAFGAGFLWYSNREAPAAVDVAATEAAEPTSQLDSSPVPEPQPEPESKPRETTPPEENITSPQVDAVFEDPDPIASLMQQLRARETPAAVAVPPPEDRPEPETGVQPDEPVQADTQLPVNVPSPVPASPVLADVPKAEPVAAAPIPRVSVRPAQLNTTDVPHLSEDVTVITRIVEPGDCLSKMIADVYKTENYQAIIADVIRYNPGIGDPDALTVGMSIIFPQFSDRAE